MGEKEEENNFFFWFYILSIRSIKEKLNKKKGKKLEKSNDDAGIERLREEKGSKKERELRFIKVQSGKILFLVGEIKKR